MSEPSKTPDTGAPIQDEVRRITGVVMEQIGSCDLESGLTVLCGVLGHVVAAMADGRPAEVSKLSDSIARNISSSAVEKMLRDDEERRKRQQKC